MAVAPKGIEILMASFDKGRLYSISYHLVQVWTVLRVHRRPKPFYPDIFCVALSFTDDMTQRTRC